MSNTYIAKGENRPGEQARIQVLKSEIPFDGSDSAPTEVPGPAHLLAASFAACILKNVERFSHILHFAYTEATVNVTLEREERPPRITRASYTLMVTTEAKVAKAELLHRNIRKFGTITNTLAASCDLDGELWVVRQNGEKELAVRDEPSRG